MCVYNKNTKKNVDYEVGKMKKHTLIIGEKIINKKLLYIMKDRYLSTLIRKCTTIKRIDYATKRLYLKLLD